MKVTEQGKNKVLVIAYYFPPMGLSGVQRIVKFIKYFREFNWEATVLTINPKGYYAFDKSLMDEVDAMEIEVVRTNSKDPTQLLNKNKSSLPNEFYRKIMNRLSQTFFLPDNKKGWRKEAVKAGLEILKRDNYDIIFATAPPFSVFQIGVELKQKTDVPLVIDYRDAWLDNEFSFYPTPFHRMLIKKMEKEVLRKADKVITYTRLLKEHLLKNYLFLNFEDVKIIPHGFDPEDFDQKVLSTKPAGKMRITYSGIFYEHRTPKYFIKAVKKLFFERPDLENKIEFCIVGHFGNHNLRMLKKYKLINAFNLVGYVDHKEAVKYLIDSDALWMMLGDKLKAKSIATGKIFEYFGSHKPVLGCVPEGAASQLLKEYEASIIVNPKDIDGIKKGILELFTDYEKNKNKIPRSEFVSKFNRRDLAYELIKEFQFLLVE